MLTCRNGRFAKDSGSAAPEFFWKELKERFPRQSETILKHRSNCQRSNAGILEPPPARKDMSMFLALFQGPKNPAHPDPLRDLILNFSN
jgi:hypothetical protein